MMPRIAALVAVLSAAPAVGASAQTLHVPYTTFTLPNGLQVLLHEDHSVPVVAVNTWYHVGSSDERAGRTGVAHLFEHCICRGAGHGPTAESAGLLGGAGAATMGPPREAGPTSTEAAPATPRPPC